MCIKCGMGFNSGTMTQYAFEFIVVGSKAIHFHNKCLREVITEWYSETGHTNYFAMETEHRDYPVCFCNSNWRFDIACEKHQSGLVKRYHKEINIMKYFLVTGPQTSIQIGETNRFESSGKPFNFTFHPELGVNTKAEWIVLIKMYATKLTHEFILGKDGLRQTPTGPVVPAYHLFSLLNEGFAKSVEDDGQKIVFWKQKGRIEDESGTVFPLEEFLKVID